MCNEGRVTDESAFLENDEANPVTLLDSSMARSMRTTDSLLSPDMLLENEEKKERVNFLIIHKNSNKETKIVGGQAR